MIRRLLLTLISLQMELSISANLHSADVTAAQKEWRLVVYSSTDSHSAEPLLQDFKSLYPSIQVEYNDLNTTEIYNRFVAEAANGSSNEMIGAERRKFSAVPTAGVRLGVSRRFDAWDEENQS